MKLAAEGIMGGEQLARTLEKCNRMHQSGGPGRHSLPTLANGAGGQFRGIVNRAIGTWEAEAVLNWFRYPGFLAQCRCLMLH